MAPPSDPLAAARSLAELISSEADAAEANGKITRPVIDALTKAGLYGLLVPEALGGFEADALTALLVFEELSRADGSTGWSYLANATTTGIAAGFTGDAAVKEMFGGPTPGIHAGMLGPRGKAKVVDGGYVARGRFSFGSGIHQANWIGAGMFLISDDGEFLTTSSGERDIRVVFVPSDSVTLQDNWDVLGLNATGSVDYLVDEQFVDESFTFSLPGPSPRRGGPVYQLGILALTAVGHCGFALGAGRRALEEIATIAPARLRTVTPTGQPMLLIDQELFRRDAAHLEAAMRAARAYAIEVFGEAQATVDRGDALDDELYQRMRQITTYATRVAVDVVNFAYEAAGSTALRRSPLQRCFRDLHSATQHIVVDATTYIEAAPVVLSSYR